MLRPFTSPGRKSLSLFVTAGFPAAESTVPLVLELANAGADVIELGIPFSDPIADGPTIQHSSEAALRNGTTLAGALSMAAAIRKKSDVRLVMMGYANPIYSYGLERFLAASSDAGVDGVIIADLPLEESGEYRSRAEKLSLSTIMLAAPTTPIGRLTSLDEASSGFLYCISVTGVTGVRSEATRGAVAFLERARPIVKKNPLFAGFGIAGPEDASVIGQHADGVIIGSALIKLLNPETSRSSFQEAIRFTQSIRRALDNH